MTKLEDEIEKHRELIRNGEAETTITISLLQELLERSLKLDLAIRTLEEIRLLPHTPKTPEREGLCDAHSDYYFSIERLIGTLWKQARRAADFHPMTKKSQEGVIFEHGPSLHAVFDVHHPSDSGKDQYPQTAAILRGEYVPKRKTKPARGRGRTGNYVGTSFIPAG